MIASLLTPESAAERKSRLSEAINHVGDYESDYEMLDGRWLEVRGKMLADGSGRPERLVGTIQDVTAHRVAFKALKKSEARQRILINELNHRVKNTLAKVLSIATLSARKSDSLEGFSEGFRARLMSLSATHDLLTREVWEGTDIRNVLEAELAPFDRDQYRLTGPSLWLQAETVLNLGLIVHELATNATKYGGLSQPGGCIDIRWTAGEGLMSLSWRETGGPVVGEPARRGFGSRLVEASTREARFRYPPAGCEADLVLVLAERATEPLDI
ncbi:HWE histidine kinase domain-containing protein [Brevundimonas sp.]|uniref:HWE histidine kinase domain-containing protein n=1 Tax=Brevundimonas sp. TaxID=1871086 RepID=UPI00356A28A7